MYKNTKEFNDVVVGLVNVSHSGTNLDFAHADICRAKLSPQFYVPCLLSKVHVSRISYQVSDFVSPHKSTINC